MWNSLSCISAFEMKSLILLLVFIVSVINADDESVELPTFHVAGIVPTMNNGTVSEQIPYMASIRLLSEEINQKFGYGHYCGGVFITRKHILTLASCLSRKSMITPQEVLVVAGTRYRYDNTQAQISAVEKIEIHPDYAINGLPNNIAVIFVSFIFSIT